MKKAPFINGENFPKFLTAYLGNQMNLTKNTLVVYFLFLSTFSGAAFGQVNKCTGPDGKVTYSDKPCPHISDKASALKIQPSISTSQPEDSTAKYNQAVKAKDTERAAAKAKNDKERAEQAALKGKILENQNKIEKIKNENYDPVKCQAARAKMDIMKTRDPLTYNLDVSFFEFQMQANLHCGN
jgi:hypothetical protein